MSIRAHAGIATLATALVLSISLALAAAPPLVSYQGVLRDNNDKPLSGSYDMIFRFADAAVAGNQLLSDSHLAANGLAVTATNGLFDVQLGSGTIASIYGYTSLTDIFRSYGAVWLEVSVGTETLSPRTRIVSAAYAINAATADNATTASNATGLGGLPATSYVTTDYQPQTKTGAMRFEWGYNGGSSVVDVVSHSSYPALTVSNVGGAYNPTCSLGGWPDAALSCGGYNNGAYLYDGSPWFSYAYIPHLTSGIEAFGSLQGGVFQNFSSGSYANVGTGSYKIVGSGSVSFVQNHPTDRSKVVVYAAPEGDEVAVYTRGSGRLVDGEAHVALGETFAMVANPDVGLTATVTPTSEVVPLAVISKSPRELVVRGPAGSNASFDYTMWGLRIGFEEQSIVQPKEREAPIPAMTQHERFFATNAALRGYTALARFKSMAEKVDGRDAIDFAAADELRESIGVYVPPPENSGPPPGWHDGSGGAK